MRKLLLFTFASFAALGCGRSALDPGGGPTPGPDGGTFCGDGRVTPPEQCDDGNNLSGDGCSSTCTLEVMAGCGNGVLELGEECDDGNRIGGDGCSAFCTREAACGDGVLDPGAGCDDGNRMDGDG